MQFQSPIVLILITALLLASCATSKPGLNTIVEDAAMKKKNNTGLMHRIIDTSIDIDAPPEEVWSVIVDFKAWESWNDFIPLVEGNLQVGERICIKVVPPGLKPMTFNPEVYVIKPIEAIVWGGSFLKIIYRGDHTFLLEPIPGGKTRFRQIERFMGPMVLFMGGMIKKTELGYHQMNIALKKQVENSNSIPRNLISKKANRGFNFWYLLSFGFERPYFLTFNQAKDISAKIKKGAQSYVVVFWKLIDCEKDGEVEEIPFLRYYRIFHVDDVEGIDSNKIPENKSHDHDFNPICSLGINDS